MKRRLTALLLIVSALIVLSGCESILETEQLYVTPHEELELPEQGVAPVPEAANISELREAVYDFLDHRQSSGRINVFEYEGDLEMDALLVREDLLLRDAMASYALSDIAFSITPIVTYMDVQVELTYRRTREQLESVMTISTERYLRTELLEMMSDYREDAAIFTRLSGITGDDVLGYLGEIYYANPLRIVMLPITTVEVYPPEQDSDGAKIIELRFGYSQESSVLKRYSEWLQSAARDVAEAATGTNDAEILLALCLGLCELSEYDFALGVLSDYSTQSFSATAYGALLNGSAIGEGYAMAFKALCDSLSLPCRVVLGERDGLQYAWNIVSYDGSYYHIDPALCDSLGIAEGFFKRDAEMTEYSWDTGLYPACDGPLNYYDIAAA